MGREVRKLSKNDLDKVLEKANKTPSSNDVVKKIYGERKSKYVAPIKKHKAKKREIPNGFPKGTVLNKDQTLTLPDGRLVRKISEVKDEQIQTA